MTTYRWKPNARVGIAPQIAGEELERISKEHNGRLIPSDIVEASRDSAAPLHPHFEWDDAVAAEKHREDQARYLVRHLTVSFDGSKKQEINVRAFVSTTQEDDKSYQGIVHAMSHEELRKQVVAKALKELESWKERYEHLSELAHVFEAIEHTRLAAE